MKTRNYVQGATVALVLGIMLFDSSTVLAKSKQMTSREMSAAIVSLQTQVAQLQKQVDELNRVVGVASTTATTPKPPAAVPSGKTKKSVPAPCALPAACP